MDIRIRNNVQVIGDGPTTLMFAHGFGCDQSMWRYMTPAFLDSHRIILFDSVGSGASDLAAYDRQKYGSLHGYASDVLEILDAYASGPVVFVGHSVAAMVGMLAAIEAPALFSALVMMGPSPSYINDGDYTGGFTRSDIEELLATMEDNYLGWSSTMAPAIMGAPDQPELGEELTSSFCRNDPDIAAHFARVTFLSDHRADVPKCTTPTLILQCSDDMVAPLAVGDYLHAHLPRSVLTVIDNVGHCPHMSSPSASAEAMRHFLDKVLQ
jgi:sigma-B regulation protein RsbQ